MSDKSKQSKKIMITARIRLKEYLFSYDDYDKLYTQLIGLIPKKLKLPERLKENANRYEFELFFSQLRKKKNTAINDAVAQFIDERATKLSKGSKKDDQVESENEEAELEKEDDKLSEDNQAELSVSKPAAKVPKYLSKAKAYLSKKKQNLKNFFNTAMDEESSEGVEYKLAKKIGRGRPAKKETKNNFISFIDSDNIFDIKLDESNSNYDDFQNSIRIVHDNNNSRPINNLNNNNSNNSNNNVNNFQFFEKGAKDVRQLNQEKLSKYYNKNHKDDKIFFQLFETQHKFNNMEDKIVSDCGQDRELSTCTLCIQFPLVPLKCQACKMIVCAKCAFDWMEKKDECPIGCQGKWKLLKPSDNELDRLIFQQYFYCEYKQFGCSQTNKIQDLVDHESTCQYKAVPCQFCKNLVIQHELSNHEKICEWRICKCKKCTFTYIAREKQTHNCIKTVLQNYQKLKQEFKQYQLDTEDKLDNFEKQINETIDKNKNKYARYPYQEQKGKYYNSFGAIPQPPASNPFSSSSQPSTSLQRGIQLNKGYIGPTFTSNSSNNNPNSNNFNTNNSSNSSSSSNNNNININYKPYRATFTQPPKSLHFNQYYDAKNDLQNNKQPSSIYKPYEPQVNPSISSSNSTNSTLSTNPIFNPQPPLISISVPQINPLNTFNAANQYQNPFLIQPPIQKMPQPQTNKNNNQETDSKQSNQSESLKQILKIDQENSNQIDKLQEDQNQVYQMFDNFFEDKDFYDQNYNNSFYF